MLTLARWVFCMALPLAVVFTYRLVPAPVRGAAGRRLGMPVPTSHLAAPLIRAGGGWPAFWEVFRMSQKSWE